MVLQCPIDHLPQGSKRRKQGYKGRHISKSHMSDNGMYGQGFLDKRDLAGIAKGFKGPLVVVSLPIPRIQCPPAATLMLLSMRMQTDLPSVNTDMLRLKLLLLARDAYAQPSQGTEEFPGYPKVTAVLSVLSCC